MAPFLSHTALKRILEFVARGTLQPETIVDLAPFPDKENLTELIRNCARPQNP